MRTTRATHAVVLVLALFIAFTSSVTLALPWYHLTAARRTHSYSLGVFPLFPLLDSFPFSWPFLPAAFVHRWLSPAGVAILWSLATALAGVALYCLITHIQFASDAAIGSYVSVATQFASPLLYTTVGFLFAHLWRVAQKT